MGQEIGRYILSVLLTIVVITGLGLLIALFIFHKMKKKFAEGELSKEIKSITGMAWRTLLYEAIVPIPGTLTLVSVGCFFISMSTISIFEEYGSFTVKEIFNPFQGIPVWGFFMPRGGFFVILSFFYIFLFAFFALAAAVSRQRIRIFYTRLRYQLEDLKYSQEDNDGENPYEKDGVKYADVHDVDRNGANICLHHLRVNNKKLPKCKALTRGVSIGFSLLHVAAAVLLIYFSLA